MDRDDLWTDLYLLSGDGRLFEVTYMGRPLGVLRNSEWFPYPNDVYDDGLEPQPDLNEPFWDYIELRPDMNIDAGLELEEWRQRYMMERRRERG
jgi:hypothetical protein